MLEYLKETFNIQRDGVLNINEILAGAIVIVALILLGILITSMVRHIISKRKSNSSYVFAKKTKIQKQNEKRMRRSNRQLKARSRQSRRDAQRRSRKAESARRKSHRRKK